jgi:BRCT domain, a BRCA1 C-terminus domain
VVSITWVQDCIEQETLLGIPHQSQRLTLDTKAYFLRDRENEKRYNTTLEQTVSKACTNNRQLFKNYQIYISTNVPGKSSLLRIVEANGGEAKIVSNTIKGRAKILRSDFLKTVDQVLVCTNTSEDKMLRGKFREEVSEGGLSSGIYMSEWIMRSVLRQEIEDSEENAILS